MNNRKDLISHWAMIGWRFVGDTNESNILCGVGRNFYLSSIQIWCIFILFVYKNHSRLFSYHFQLGFYRVTRNQMLEIRVCGVNFYPLLKLKLDQNWFTPTDYKNPIKTDLNKKYTVFNLCRTCLNLNGIFLIRKTGFNRIF